MSVEMKFTIRGSFKIGKLHEIHNKGKWEVRWNFQIDSIFITERYLIIFICRNDYSHFRRHRCLDEEEGWWTESGSVQLDGGWELGMFKKVLWSSVYFKNKEDYLSLHLPFRFNWFNCNIQYEEEIIDHCSFALITKFKLHRSLHHRLLKSIFNS